MIFLGHNRQRLEPADLHAGRARCSLDQANELIRFFFLGNNRLQRVQLLVERIHLLFQFRIALFVNLELRHFLAQLRPLHHRRVVLIFFSGDRRAWDENPHCGEHNGDCRGHQGLHEHRQVS